MTDDRRGAAAVVTLKNAANPLCESNSSGDENDIDEETISGENDVEYAEFSMSLQMSPKDDTKTTNADKEASTVSGSKRSSKNDQGGDRARDFSRLDDDFMLSLTAMSDNAASSSNVTCELKL